MSKPQVPDAHAPHPAEPARSPLGWLAAMIGQRCPRCHEGRMFEGGMTMNDPCPVCGLVFQREEGYFLGAMYTSYALSVGLISTFFLIATALFPAWGSMTVAGVALIPFLPLIPSVFRYSRVLWIYLDRASDTGNVSATVYEKLRQQQDAEHPPGPIAEGEK